jgi:hypothetical protein
MHTVSCLTGFFQADSVIADHTLLEHCDIIFGNDADFSFLAGRNCLQVHEFKYLWRTDELSNFTLKTGFRSTIMAALEASNELTVEKNLRLAVYPLIDKNIVQMMKKESSMTWFEEWFLFFQWEWGRESTTLTLLLDFFKMSESTIRRVLRHKLNAVLEARKRWPRFATLEEDVTLMSAWWQNKYGTKRVILWDDTNINIPAASDSHLNRHTYSAHYAGNVAKGAVFLQLCGWMGTWELWAGAISDMEYQTRSGVFEYM